MLTTINERAFRRVAAQAGQRSMEEGIRRFCRTLATPPKVATVYGPAMLVHWNTLALALGVLTEGAIWDGLTLHVVALLVAW